MTGSLFSESRLRVSSVEAAKLAFVFPGQGAQVVGMGQDLSSASKAAKLVFDEADEALGFSLSRICFEGPEEELRQTINTQPAIMVTSVACYRALQEALGAEALSPAFVAGHSLGEYSALVAAGAVAFADAVRLVRERGRLMQEAGDATPSGMAAVMGLDEDKLEPICRSCGVQIGNINSPGQITISGPQQGLAEAMQRAKGEGARRVVALNVSGAFHSEVMRPAAQGLSRALREVEISNAAVPTVANVTARPIVSAADIKNELVDQLCNPVRWQASVEAMVGSGVSHFVEVGPGQVLAGLIKRCCGDVRADSIGDVASLRAFLQGSK